ncbi:Gfo/Idh/MocA family protein [Sphingobacterium sp. Mn56C]|uniref:Gfo/Idh/MocA family protein n=1 Tax=Sphingobacterium sp. Mn56C TaxID=3395261 RepID=UPI003BC7EF17
MDKQLIHTGILSFGMSGRVFHAPFIHSNPHFKLSAVVERSNKVAHNHYPNIKSYDSVAELLKDDSIELVIVNTPNHTHFELAAEVLAAGKHVLLEKPAVERSAELEELALISARTGKKLFFYQNRRYDSHFLAVKDVIDRGVLGKILEVHIRFDRYKMELGQKDFKENSSYTSSGLVYDLGPHVVDQAISLFGKPQKVIKTTAMNRINSVVPDYFNFHLRYADNLQVFLTGSLLVADPQPAYVLHGTTGSFTKPMADVQEKQLMDGLLPTDPAYGIEADNDAGRLVTIAEDGTKETAFLPAFKGDYNLLFNAIYANLRNNTPYPITLDSIKWQLEVLEAPNFNAAD